MASIETLDFAVGQVMGETLNAIYEAIVSLPYTTVAELELEIRGVNLVILAVGSETTLEVYGVAVPCQGQLREVVAAQAQPKADVEVSGQILIHA